MEVDKDLDPDQPINEMDLVEIRSHPVEDCSGKSASLDTTKQTVTLQPKEQAEHESHEESKKAVREEVKGFALTVKESYAEEILRICSTVRPNTFLQSGVRGEGMDEERPIMCTGGSQDQLVIVSDEAALISAIDQKQIASWPDFEYVLCLVVENRILRLY